MVEMGIYVVLVAFQNLACEEFCLCKVAFAVLRLVESESMAFLIRFCTDI